MIKKPIPDVLILRRTQPVQGKPVAVQLRWNDQQCGELYLPFVAWIKLNRLLSHGVAMDKKEDSKLNVKVRVEGLYESTVEPPALQFEGGISNGPRNHTGQPAYRGGISNMAAEEEDDDSDIKAAERQARLDAHEVQIRESQEKQQEAMEVEAQKQNKIDAENENLVRSLRPEPEGE